MDTPYTPERLLALSRGHWAVENNLHWVLGVTMSEDVSLVRRGHGPRNRATLKRVALNGVRIVTGKNFLRHTMRDAPARRAGSRRHPQPYARRLMRKPWGLCYSHLPPCTNAP